MIKVNDCVVEFQTFPNGETKVVQESILNALHKGEESFVDVVLKYEDDGDLIKLMFVSRYLDSKVGYDIKIILRIMYMPYSRMDRIEGDSVFTLKYVTDFINTLGFDKVVVNEAHSDVTVSLLDTGFSNLVTPKLLLKASEELGWSDNDYIMFPDAGAMKRYQEFFTPTNTIIGHKKRDFETGRITGLELEGKVEDGDKRVIIVDDLTSYGGTFVKSAEKLMELGFKEIYLVVSHAENVIFDGVLFKYIDKLYTTDSILNPDTEQVKEAVEKNKLKVYSMGEF